jgi:hypothetical protein
MYRYTVTLVIKETHGMRTRKYLTVILMKFTFTILDLQQIVGIAHCTISNPKVRQILAFSEWENNLKTSEMFFVTESLKVNGIIK